ncbi:MAG: hypothetical protein ACOX88_01780 [Christensenellales bacterium]|jgi:hypothetical protein
MLSIVADEAGKILMAMDGDGYLTEGIEISSLPQGVTLDNIGDYRYIGGEFIFDESLMQLRLQSEQLEQEAAPLSQIQLLEAKIESLSKMMQAQADEILRVKTSAQGASENTK